MSGPLKLELGLRHAFLALTVISVFAFIQNSQRIQAENLLALSGRVKQAETQLSRRRVGPFVLKLEGDPRTFSVHKALVKAKIGGVGLIEWQDKFVSLEAGAPSWPTNDRPVYALTIDQQSIYDVEDVNAFRRKEQRNFGLASIGLIVVTAWSFIRKRKSSHISSTSG